MKLFGIRAKSHYRNKKTYVYLYLHNKLHPSYNAHIKQYVPSHDGMHCAFQIKKMLGGCNMIYTADKRTIENVLLELKSPFELKAPFKKVNNYFTAYTKDIASVYNLELYEVGIS